jgi:hypothetical protein
MKRKIVVLLAVMGIILIGCSTTAKDTATPAPVNTDLPTQVATKSTNAELSILSVDSGTLRLTFAAAITAYTVNVSNVVTSITMTGSLA